MEMNYDNFFILFKRKVRETLLVDVLKMVADNADRQDYWSAYRKIYSVGENILKEQQRMFLLNKEIIKRVAAEICFEEKTRKFEV